MKSHVNVHKTWGILSSSGRVSGYLYQNSCCVQYTKLPQGTLRKAHLWHHAKAIASAIRQRVAGGTEAKRVYHNSWGRGDCGRDMREPSLGVGVAFDTAVLFYAARCSRTRSSFALTLFHSQRVSKSSLHTVNAALLAGCVVLDEAYREFTNRRYFPFPGGSLRSGTPDRCISRRERNR